MKTHYLPLLPWLIMLPLLLPLASNAQEMKVRSMVHTNDVTANDSRYMIQDNNGDYAGLVKVMLAATNATFEGNILKQQLHNASEHWVFMMKGSSRLRVIVPNLHPLEVDFQKYNCIINSRNTYELTISLLKEPETTSDGDAPEITISEGDYIDLGLPSGTLWASRNIGADHPEEDGDYFAWGDAKGYDYSHDFSWKNYKWHKGGNHVKKYNTGSNSTGKLDMKEELELADDAAQVNWGAEWRIPSYIQVRELIEYCTLTWATYKGKKGCLVRGVNGNSIFFPAAGECCIHDRKFSTKKDDNAKLYYWSRTVDEKDPSQAKCFEFSSKGVGTASGSRSHGRSIRAILLNNIQNKKP